MNCASFHIRALHGMLMLLIPLAGFMAHQHHAHLDTAGNPRSGWETHHHHHDGQSDHPVEHDHQPVSNFLSLFATAANRISTVHQVTLSSGDAPVPASLTVVSCESHTEAVFHPDNPGRLQLQKVILHFAANLSPPSFG